MSGIPIQIAPDVLRLCAQNQGPLTGSGTNSYLVFGPGGAVLVDAGPPLPEHVSAVLTALQGAPLRFILLTHAHLDHSGAAMAIASQTGARLASFGPAELPNGAGPEGADATHDPDLHLQDGDVIALPGLGLKVVHTPGHMQGHLCFGHRDMLFSGDHVMGWASTLVAPPEGDMAAYRASLRKLQGLGYARYLPGHGETITDPEARLAELIRHRDLREKQILSVLSKGAACAEAITSAIYRDLAPDLRPAAAQNVLAHLIELATNGQVQGANPHRRSTVFCLR